jgi:signal transduction histidine kinase
MNLRDRLLGAVAVIVVIALAGLIVLELQRARDAGLDAREELRLEQVQTLASSMDARIEAVYGSIVGAFGQPGSWNLVANDPADAERLARQQQPNARTGMVLVDLGGRIVNGTLLQSAAVGDRFDRPGLDAALGEGGRPAILPVAPGVTTSLPTVGIAVPLADATGTPAGAFLFEVEVAADSAFSREVEGLEPSGGGTFAFVDQFDVVVASSDPSLLGTRLVSEAYDEGQPGFHREGGEVAAVAEVPTAEWRLAFVQDASAFDGSLVRPLRSAVLLVAIAAVVGAAVSVVALVRRLAGAREEQRRLRRISEEQEEFTSIVSHELRTPVTGLLGFLQTVLDHWHTMGDEERRAAVERALANAARLHALTRDVLDTALVDAPELPYHLDVLDLRREVEDAALAARDAEPERPVDVDVPARSVLVSVDGTRIRQVLTNLLDNAAKSSPPGTPVHVSVRVDGSEAAVAVADQGPGIAPDQAERVFERFVRGRPAATRGSGLGLYICRRIVEAHGGRIWVDDPGAPGARIVFSLPLASEPESAPATAPASS